MVNRLARVMQKGCNLHSHMYTTFTGLYELPHVITYQLVRADSYPQCYPMVSKFLSAGPFSRVGTAVTRWPEAASSPSEPEPGSRDPSPWMPPSP